MCGIAGIINKGGVDTVSLMEMSNAIKHRGPDDEGYVFMDSTSDVVIARGDDTVKEMSDAIHIRALDRKLKKNIGFAHRRLSILDVSAAAHQPFMFNGYIMTYNGEVYNYKEIRAELRNLGYFFDTDCDTEVIIKSYKEWGNDCVKKFIGMWAFAIYNPIKNHVFISRDRFGIKPLYYTLHEGGFVFASEIKSLLKSVHVQNSVNQKELFSYMYWGRTSTPIDTLFEGVKELPVATNLTYNLSDYSFKIESYYSLSDVIKNYSSTNNNVFEEYSNLFENSIKLHMRSDVEVGACLSGGLDSSAIVYSASKLSIDKKFKTFTVGFNNKEIDETDYAKSVVKHLGNIDDYHIIPTTDDFLKQFSKMVYHQDLPVASSSIFAQWKVMELAANNNIKVLLDGQGADETLGGYSNFMGVFLLDKLKRINLSGFYKEADLLKKNRSINVYRELGRAGFAYLPNIAKKHVREKKRIGHNFLDKEFIREYKNSSSLKEGNCTSFLDSSLMAVKHGMHGLLRYEDRNSMAHSIESRVPFLDHRLVEFSLSINSNYKIQNGWSKYVLRKFIDGKLPSSVVWRKDKKGFVTPQREWKSKLSNQLHDYINQINFPDFLNKEFLLDKTAMKLKNSSDLSQYWKAISVTMWMQNYNN